MNPKLVELYYEGDQIGAPYEGSQMMCPKECLPPDPRGTDESDTLRCILGYLETCEAKETEPDPVEWARYFTKHRGSYRYGKTYPDMWRTVEYLDKRGALTLEKLAEISEDRDSAGNGCLTLVAPLVAYGFKRDYTLGKVIMMISGFTGISHANHGALIACNTLANMLILGPNLTWQKKDFGESALGRPTAISTLNTAIICSDHEDKQMAITTAIHIGGDVDSILALTLLLWGVRRGEHVVG